MRKLIDFFVKFVAWANKRKIISSKEKIVKVNIGSGMCVAKGYINIDASLNALISNCSKSIIRKLYKFSNNKSYYSEEEYCNILKNNKFYCFSVQYGMPFKNDSIDYLYSSHLMEHLYYEEAKYLMKEAYRVLKNNGIIRICVPDLEYALSLYKSSNKKKFLEFFFSEYRSGYLSRHHYMYDFELLRELLEDAGFTNIQKHSYKHGNTPDIEVLDNRPEETLYVEATVSK